MLHCYSPVFRTNSFFALLFLLTLARQGAAQNWSGLAHSNYGGTQNIYLNPASLADSRHTFYLNLASGNANFYNTYLQLDLPDPAIRFLKDGREFRSRYLKEQGGSEPHFATITAEVRLPSFMLALGRHQGLAFSNRVRVFVQATNVSQNLARLARYGLDDADSLGLIDRLAKANDFTLAGGAYHEFAFSYARAFTNNQTHFWKGGVTAKYLVGLAGGYLQNEGTSYQVYNSDSIQLRNTNLGYGFTDPDFYDRSDFGIGTLYGKQRLGRGLGVDVGVVYEWRPTHDQYKYRMDGRTWTDPTRNKYRLRLGLALTDIGAIRYQNDEYVHQARVANSRTLQIGQLDSIHLNDANDLAPTLDRLVGLAAQSRRFTSYLPTTLRLSADYRLANHLFTGLQWTQSLLPEKTIGQRTVSSLVLTPRIEFSHAEVAMPILLANRYRKLQLGAMVRLGPLLLGSDNLGGLFGLTTTTGADVYVGLGFALHKKRQKDRDKDQVSNKLDKCPKVQGTWELQGCPAPAIIQPAASLEPTPSPEPATPPQPEPSAPAQPASTPSAPPAPAPATP